MAVVTLRPNSTTEIGADWSTNAGSHHAGLSDNSDGTYSRYSNAFAGSPFLWVGMDNLTIPAGSVVNSVRPKVRASLGQFDNACTVYVSGRVSGGTVASWMVVSTLLTFPPQTFTGAARTTRPAGGAWTIDDVNNVEVGVQQGAGSEDWIDVEELYLDVDYTPNTAPTPSSITVPTQLRGAPTVTWVYSDPEGNPQVNSTVNWYKSDGSLYLASGVVSSAAVTRLAAQEFSPGLYYATVTVSDGSLSSSAVQSNTFRVVNSPLMIL